MFNISGGSARVAGADTYLVQRSLRFRQGVTANLTRTPASNGSRTTMTYSVWVKGMKLDSMYQDIFSSNNSGGVGDAIGFRQQNLFMQTNGNTGGTFQSNNIYRDPSAWYHIVMVFDTTQATSTNRLKIYVNGVQITSFSSITYPALNAQVPNFNTTTQQMIGAGYNANGGSLDGYLAEVYFIDGQALTPSSFGATNADTGVWRAKAYTGTYGTNGFYLPFTDNSALTTSSNVGLGKDFSGNSNYWVTNNISITAGSTYDSMTDVPTNTSITAGNYCVLNPLDNGGNTLSAGNLNAASGVDKLTRTTFGMSSGKWYCEVTITAVGGSTNIGIANSSASNTSLGNNANSWAYNNTGVKVTNASGSAYGASFTTNDIIGIAFDADTGSLTFYKNNTSQGVAFTGLTSGPYFIAYGSNAPTLAFNFGQRPFSYTPPTGFNRLNSFNLPSSTVLQGNKVMDATLYTGNGTTQTITNAAGFRPDLVWFKERSSNSSNWLFDTIRGVLNRISSNETTAEANQTGTLTAFNSNGFSVGSDVASNESGITYVGWQWQAGSSTVTNTSGSISAQVRANTTAGFSVVTYTGNGVAGATFGHGLGVAPKMIAFKARSLTNNWGVWHTSLGINGALNLNTTAVVSVQNAYFNGTLPTSTLVTVGTDNSFNSNGATYVAYCWAEIAGFSKFGSYTGNGSTDGTFVYTGFRPKFIMIKTYSGTVNQWFIFDSAKNPYNVTNSVLFANTNGAESGAAFANIDILSNGFKCRTTDNGLNSSGLGLIYAAFAENPFKNSNAR